MSQLISKSFNGRPKVTDTLVNSPKFANLLGSPKFTLPSINRNEESKENNKVNNSLKPIGLCVSVVFKTILTLIHIASKS